MKCNQTLTMRDHLACSFSNWIRSTYDNLIFQKAEVQFSSGVHENYLPQQDIQRPRIYPKKNNKESMLRNGKIGKEIPNYEFQKIIQSNLDLSRLPLELLDDEIC